MRVCLFVFALLLMPERVPVGQERCIVFVSLYCAEPGMCMKDPVPLSQSSSVSLSDASVGSSALSALHGRPQSVLQ